MVMFIAHAVSLLLSTNVWEIEKSENFVFRFCSKFFLDSLIIFEGFMIKLVAYNNAIILSHKNMSLTYGSIQVRIACNNLQGDKY